MQDYAIHALWAHPRSMSTAFERVMRERGDLDCLHEPFMYDYYIHRQTRRLPMFDPQPGHPVSYDDVRAMILERASRTPVFFKDMSYYVLPHLLDDDAFCNRITHAFLVRDPVASIVSYHRLDPDLTLIEVGIEAQWRHYQALLARGQHATVMLAEDVRADPVGVISAYWRAAGLADRPDAFSWSGDTPADWQQVAGWHGSVTASGAIRPVTPADRHAEADRFARAAATAPFLKDLLDHHRPYYDRFRDVALSP